jgi:flagellar basal body-associated protein FliL
MAKASKSDAEGRKPRRLPMLIALGVVAVAGWKFVLAPAPAAESKAEEPAVIEEGDVLPLPELVLNLADDEPRYLRVGIALILEAGAPTEAVKEELPIASDVAVDVLSAKTYAELHRPNAKQAVKEELSTKVREAFHDEKVARVIFTSFVMQ